MAPDNGGITSPTALPRGSWVDTLKRTVREFQDDKLQHWAAALTYYAVLSIFPALLVMVSLVGAFFRLLRRCCAVLRKKRSSILRPRSATINLFVPCLFVPLLLDSISASMYEEPWLGGPSRNVRLR